MSHKISIGFSPCPNDTFIFDALVNYKIDHDYQFQTIIADVEQLNEMALKGMLDITKLSYSAYFNVTDQYYLFQSGSALGKGVGPLLIAQDDLSNKDEKDWKVALPGKMTTAHLLFSLAYPHITNKSFMLFSEIEQAVLDGTYDGGVIIHENRFTYKEKGLYCVQDLGDYWESQFQVPIPLGGIAGKKSLAINDLKQIEELIRKSTQYAFDHSTENSPFITAFAQEMDAEVRKKHIETYVNQYTLELGKKGKNAINVLGKQASKTFRHQFEYKNIFLPGN